MPRFLHPYLVCLLACAAIGAFAVIVVKKSMLLRQADLAATLWHDLVTTNERTLGALRDAETGQRGYLLTQQADYLEPYQFATCSVPELTRLLESLTRDLPDQRIKGQQIAELARQKLAELAATISLAQGGNTREAAALVATNRGKALMDQIR